MNKILKPTPKTPIPIRQQGAALIVSLFILLLMTLLSLSGTQTTMMQEKMTSAVRDSNIALESAESGVKEAEAYIEGLVSTSSFSATGDGGIYSEGNAPADYFSSAIWTDAKTIAATHGINDTTARYFVVDIGEIDVEADNSTDLNLGGYGKTTVGGGEVTAFRAVARGTGQSGTAERIIITMYGKRL